MKKKAKVIAVVNQKGGVGKTTSSYCLAYQLGRMGKKVLLVDSDSQANATQNHGYANTMALENALPGLMLEAMNSPGKAFEIEYPDNYVLKKNYLDVLPSNLTLSAIEVEMVKRWDTNPDVVFTMKRVLENYIENYDYIFIDCLPSIVLLVQNAMVAADSVIIPTKPSYFSTSGLKYILDSIYKIKSDWNPELKVEGILLTMCVEHVAAPAELIQFIEKKFGPNSRVFKNRISLSTVIETAQLRGQCVIEYRSWCKVAKQYIALTKEFLALQEEVNE